MCIFSHQDRQSIINRVYVHFVIQRHPSDSLGTTEGTDCYQRPVKSAMGVFGSEQLDGIPGLGIAAKCAHSPEAVIGLFKQNDKRRLDNDDIAFLIDLEAEHDSAIRDARPFRRFHGAPVFDESFRDGLRKRLDRLAIDQGLKRPATVLSSEWP